MTEHEVALAHEGNRLAGTLCVPGAGRHPTVIMIAGSGPLDRDENMRGQRLDVFNTLAHRLASAGYASVRYDKRECGASTGTFATAGISDFVSDAVAWVDWAAASEHADPRALYLLGHSEGTLVAALAIAQRPSVAGGILLAPFFERMEAMLMRQAAQIERELSTRWLARLAMRVLGRPTANQRALIDRARATTSDTFRMRGTTVSAKWLRELLAIDAGEVFARVACPLLVVGGAKDLQCDPADVERVAALASGPVEAHVLADLTHVLRADERPAAILGYAQLLAKPIDARVIELVDGWLDAQRRNRRSSRIG